MSPQPNSPARLPPAQVRLNVRLPAVWLGLALIAAFLLPDRIWNTLLVGLGGLFVFSYFWAGWLARGLNGRRQLRYGWVSVGDRLSEQFEVWNHSIVPALWVEVRDHSNVPGYNASIVRSLGEGGLNRWRQAAVCTRRGQFHLGPWELRSGDPFGIFTVIRRFDDQQEIIIHPPIHGRIPIPLPAGSSDGRVRTHHRAQLATINATSVRDYQPQDPYRWIHWRTSARRDGLYVREFDLDVSGDVWLLLDLETAVQLGSGPDGTEEHAVLLAASLAARAIRQNRAVGLAAYGQTPQLVPPGHGQGTQWRLLRALALAQADGDISLRRALQDLSQQVKRGTTALIITPTNRADWLPELLTLAQRGIQSSIILLDRASFQPEGVLFRGVTKSLHEEVRRLGFAAHIVEQGAIGVPLVAQERRGYWEFQVTGTGRVITVTNPLQEAAS